VARLDFIGSSQSSCMSLFFDAQQEKRPEVTGIFHRLIPYIIEWKMKRKKELAGSTNCCWKSSFFLFFLFFSTFFQHHPSS
jgi:hypothetical protein